MTDEDYAALVSEFGVDPGPGGDSLTPEETPAPPEDDGGGGDGGMLFGCDGV
jgi:hypothetical protein